MSYGQTGYAVDVPVPKMATERSSSQKKIKKPWFLKRWVINWVREDWEKEREINSMESIAIGKISKSREYIDDAMDNERALRFNVYHANGGRVIEINQYDRQKDRHKKNLYVITSEQDFGREIDKIITMEALR